ncbi:MAG: hypothetical protein QW407_07370, partial [Thermofilaceae archaeon]
MAALLATAPLATAAPIKVWWIQIKDQTGKPLANEEILVAVWNETKNCALAYFKGKTDGEGKATLTIIAGYPLDTGPSAGTFNITVAINKYGRWMLLNQSTGIGWGTLVGKYVNKTVTAGHWWSLNFTALTDPDGDGTFTPLHFDTGLGEDLASFQVFWNDTREFITEIWAKSGTATAKVLFNISDTEVTFTEVGTGCFLFKFKPVVLYKEVIWNLFVNKGEYTPVKAGAEILKFNATAKTLSIINATPIGKIGPTIATVGLTPVTDVTDYAYTVFLRVNVLDACGSLIDTGAFETWDVSIQALNVTLRSGRPARGVAPAFGAVAPDLKFAFWVPDVTKVYGKKYNVTVNINYYTVQVFTATIPTNVTSLTLTDQLGTYMVLTTTPRNVRVIDAFTSVVKTRIIVKDMQPTPQPLSGARLIIAMEDRDPIYSATGPGGAVYLPPFTTTAVAETSGDFGRAYASVYSEDGVPYGYLPVPFTYRASRAVATYIVRIFWLMPLGENWVDVTPDQNTFTLNITAHIKDGCPITTFTYFAKVFKINVRAVDLCNQPITPDVRDSVYLVAYLDGRRIGPVGLGADGTVNIGLVPAGKLKFRLYWKGIFLRANVTQPVEPEIEVTKNIATAVTLEFPIGNLSITLTMWDINYPIHKLDVKLQYVKDGKVVFEEPARVTDCYGKVTFTKVPIQPLTVDEGAGHTYELRVIAYTREDTPYIRPQDAGLLVANETIKFEKLKLECWNEYVVPTWIYSFRVIAVDHTGATLKGLPTDIGTIPVAVLLNDTTYEPPVKMCCPEICAPPTCVCPAPGEVTVDFRILNETKDEAIFIYYSQQYYDSDPEKDTIGIQPHMFVAGAKYHFMVFHGGVLVY